jgi:hypothetical protein
MFQAMDAETRTPRKMRQTTLRFGEELWRSLEVEAERDGVSVAQYVRDAAVGRLAYEAGRRDELNAGVAAATGVDAAAARERSLSETSQSDALWAQGKLARERAIDLRARSQAARLRVVDNKA